MDEYDDFERFRQIAQPSARDNYAPFIQTQDRQQIYGKTLNVDGCPTIETSSKGCSGQMGSSLSVQQYLSREGVVNISPMHRAARRHSGVSPDKIAGVWQSPSQHIEIPADLLNRSRAGSMKEVRRRNFNTNPSGCRPSAPFLYPSKYSGEQTSPSRFSNHSEEERQSQKIRRFQVNKDGHVVKKCDKEMIYTEGVRPVSPFDTARPSLPHSKPIIYTDDNSEKSDNSTEGSDVIEIPAITTTLHTKNSSRQSLNMSTEKIQQPQLTIFTRDSLHPEFRSRSRSWGMVHEQDQAPSRSATTPKSTESNNLEQFLRVQVIGNLRVGKTSLCCQFQTSESLDVTMDNAADDQPTTQVTVEVNSTKYTLEFVDTNMECEDAETFDPAIIDSADAYLVVYAIDDKTSFCMARSIISTLMGEGKRSSAIILVANKSDLVRARVVSVEEAKNLASVFSCDFYEISTSLNHRVDDLLVGIIMAIQQRRRDVERERDRLEKMSIGPARRGSFTTPAHRASIAALKTPANTVVKFFQKHFTKTKDDDLKD